MSHIIILFLSLIADFAFANECINNYKPQVLISKALEKEILFELKGNEIDSLDGFIQHAYEIYNPDFEHFTTTGDQFGKRNITSESRIWFNLQLGNKTEKKANVFRAQKEISQAQLDLLKLKVRKELYLALLRFKQIHKELVLLGHMKDAMAGLITRYNNQRVLTPQQKMEKGSLEMSNSDLNLKETEIMNEKFLILRLFQKSLREECNIEIALENQKDENSWPNITSLSYKPNESLNFKLTQLTIKKSQFELAREDIMEHPDLKIGPVWQLNRLGNQEYNLFGLSFIVPLPFTDRNKGLRSASNAVIDRNTKESEYVRTQTEKDFEVHHANYARLKEKFHPQDIDKYDALLVDYRSMFKQGVISIPNFLSYKREFLNYIHEVHATEVSMAENMLEIYFINNQSTEDFVPQVLHL